MYIQLRCGLILLLLAIGVLRARAETVSQSARQIPVVRNVDVLVIGGTVGGVAAATEAARAGAGVLLVAPKTYLGEDLCATLRLWLDGGAAANGELTQAIFAERRTATPLHVKQTLEAALLKSDVEFLLACYATDVLVDSSGRFAGVVIANRAGRQAIVAKCVIDATDRGLVAEIAGARRYPVLACSLRCKRVVLGGRSDVASEATCMIPAGISHQGEPLVYYETTLELEFDGANFKEIAEAEQQMRDLTYREGQLRAAEQITVLWQDPFRCRKTAAQWPADGLPGLEHFRPNGVPGVFLLSGAADIPRNAVESLLRPASVETLGRRIGRLAAAEALRCDVPTGVTVSAARAAAAGDSEILEDVREVWRAFHGRRRWF